MRSIIARLATSLLSPLHDPAPVAPQLAPAAWTLLAASRRELVGAAEPRSALDKVPAAAVNNGAPFTPPSVDAVPRTPPLAWLQRIPVLGPLAVTPIVAFIHHIPIVSDLIHPLVGYPLERGLPAGTPVARDVKVVSFDGTPISVHFMPATNLAPGQKAPTIFEGPGLPLPGATNIDGAIFDKLFADNLGQISVLTLRNAGYNVVTWDPRGEYYSGGQLEIDSPDFEARDVSAIISWVATQPEVQLDSGRLDPRMGMVGVSYGGGIQLVTAAIDPRVDAIVPTIAWNTLPTSLYKSQAFKTGWSSILGALLKLTGARPNPRIYPALTLGKDTGLLSASDLQLLADRGPDFLLDKITIPTLFIQGTVDTLFTLQEAAANAQVLAANEVPTSVLWFCGGHGLCTNNLSDLTDGTVITQRTLGWLDQYVKGLTPAETAPAFEWVDQRGQYFASNTYPLLPAGHLTATGAATQTLPLRPLLSRSGPLLGILPIGGTKARVAINLATTPVTTTTHIVGTPQVSFTYTGTGTGRHIYAQLVDNATGRVVGNQVTPIPVTLDGQTHTTTVALEQVAATLSPGQTLSLQLVAASADYRAPRSTGTITVSDLTFDLPTVTDAQQLL